MVSTSNQSVPESSISLGFFKKTDDQVGAAMAITLWHAMACYGIRATWWSNLHASYKEMRAPLTSLMHLKDESRSEKPSSINPLNSTKKSCFSRWYKTHLWDHRMVIFNVNARWDNFGFDIGESLLLCSFIKTGIWYIGKTRLYEWSKW